MNDSAEMFETEAKPLAARLSGAAWQVWCRALTVVLLTSLLYHKIVAGLVLDWWSDPNWSHGFMVPIFSAFLIWRKRKALAGLPRRPAWFGAVIIGGALSALVLGSLGAEYFISRFSFLILLAGFAVYFFGWKHFRTVAFAWAFLVFMIPIPAIIFNHITFPLQLEASWLAGEALPRMGVPVLREGNVIQLPEMSLEVAQACSGIRSLMSLGMLAVMFAHLLESRISRQAVLIAAAAPIAIFVNGMRIVATGLLVHYGSAQQAEGFFHTFEGWLLFGFSLLLFFGLHGLMRLVARQPTRQQT